MTELSLTAERTIAAPRAVVFDAWLDPEMLSRFMIPGPGMRCHSVRADPTAGGRFSLVMARDGSDMPHGGTYKEIAPHTHIVFTWESPFSVEGSTVTVTFADVAAGTHVKLTHVKFASEEARDNHLGGWTAILTALDAALC